jgi:hypothetical protein
MDCSLRGVPRVFHINPPKHVCSIQVSFCSPPGTFTYTRAIASQLRHATNIAWSRRHGLRRQALSIAPNVCEVKVTTSRTILET